MAVDATLQFYNPIPRFGQKFALQLGDMRDNSNSLSTLVRAAFADTDGGTNSQNLNLSGWALGEKNFRNRFRIFYDKAADEFKMQFNTGTQSVPIWTTCVRIRQDDCRFIVVGEGGLQLDGGFYGGSNLNTGIDVRDSDDPAAGARNTTALVFNSLGFYTSGTSTSGETMVNLRPSENAPGFYGLIVQESDGSNTQDPGDVLQFAVADFIVSDNSGKPLVTLETIDHGALGGLADDDHTQYARTDGTRDITGHQRFDDTINVENVVTAEGFYSPHFGEVAYKDDIGPGFYGLLVKESQSGGYEKKTDELIFDSGVGFYLSSAGNGKPIVSFADAFSASQFFTSASEWTFTHNLGATFITWGVYDGNFEAMFPSRAVFNDKNVASFYFAEANEGHAVVRKAGF